MTESVATRLPASLPCPACKGTLYLCRAKHVDEKGPRYHCTASQYHTYFPIDLGINNEEEGK